VDPDRRRKLRALAAGKRILPPGDFELHGGLASDEALLITFFNTGLRGP